MMCENCEYCIEDYTGKPYCFIGQFSLADLVGCSVFPCDDFMPKEET